MEIRIDTEKDSPAQIRKAISFLQSIVDEKNQASGSSVSEGNSDFFGMFNDQSQDSQARENTSGSQDSMLNIFNDETKGASSFSIDDELSRNEGRKEEEEDNRSNISVIPY